MANIEVKEIDRKKSSITLKVKAATENEAKSYFRGRFGKPPKSCKKNRNLYIVKG